VTWLSSGYTVAAFCSLGSLLLVSGCAHETVSPKALDEFVVTSRNQEAKGDLTAAVERLKIALTLDPDNSVARSELGRMIIKRDQEAEKRYRSGLSLKENDPAGARREFLAALRIRSDYREALLAIKELQLESSELSIKARIKKQAATHSSSKQSPQYEESIEETYLDTAIAHYEDGNYSGAINVLMKAKNKNPNSPDIARYLNLSWYHQGITWFTKHDYRKALVSFSRVRKNFERVNDYAAKCRQLMKDEAEKLYRVGLKFFREQKLQGAIATWNQVLTIDPGHRKAREYIDKAQKLLNALQKRS